MTEQEAIDNTKASVAEKLRSAGHTVEVINDGFRNPYGVMMKVDGVVCAARLERPLEQDNTERLVTLFLERVPDKVPDKVAR